MLKFFRIPFATNGDRTAVPDAIDPSGFVSYDEGYGFDYQRQETDPASKDIERDKMNEIYFDMTTAVAELQAQGVPDFITSVLNGGAAYSYGLNAMCVYNGQIYISRKTANTSLPSVSADWSLIRPATARAVAGGTANAVTADFVPDVFATIQDGETVQVYHSTANTGAATLAADGGAATAIVKGADAPLSLGDIPGAGFWGWYQWSATLTKWVMLNPATGVSLSTAQIQTVTSSVAGSALTAGSAATVYDFPNPTLSNGTPIPKVVVPARSIVVPSGATLGTVSGQAATLVLLTAYNGGTPVQCIVNLAGGNQLDETNLISPTTISAGATAANVIYSASAVGAGSPYRVDGYLTITEATAGTWATDATVKRGVGGQALASMSSLGFGQSYKTYTVGVQRISGTTYYNLSPKPIFLSISGSSIGGVTVTINGVVAFANLGSSAISGVFLIVPPFASYTATFASPIDSWAELN